MVSSLQLELYAEKIHSKGAGLDNCWGFVDGTVSQFVDQAKIKEFFTMDTKECTQ